MVLNVEKFQKECLAEHNRLRALHGVPQLKLSKELCTYAQEWAKHLSDNNKLEHRQNAVYGENIYMARGAQIDGKIPAKRWYDEIKDYNFSKSTFSSGTGHFTQVIWKTTTELGVGVIEKGNTRYVVANYNPPGNVLNKFQENVPGLKRR